MSVRPDSGKIISFITEPDVIRQILQHIGLRAEKLSRDPPSCDVLHDSEDIIYEPFDNGWPRYKEFLMYFLMLYEI